MAAKKNEQREIVLSVCMPVSVRVMAKWTGEEWEVADTLRASVSVPSVRMLEERMGEEDFDELQRVAEAAPSTRG